MDEGTSYDALLEQVILDGCEEVRAVYAEKDEQREGALSGFEACRGKPPSELKRILGWARKNTAAAFRSEQRYWFWRMRELQIEWVCNVVSAALVNQGDPEIIPPTARGVMKAAAILGVASHVPKGATA